MVLAFLVILNASSLCVARTDVCAPAGSSVDGTIGENGGLVTITPSTTMRALGAEFRAKTKVLVNVLPWWSSDNTSGAIVHVTGELTKETLISGARVAGIVQIGQVQGQKSRPQLVEGTDFKGGQLVVGAGVSVDVGPGMKVGGNVDIDRVILDVTSAKPMHAFGLDLDAGTIRLEYRSTGTTVVGTLVRPQQVRGVLVEQQLNVTIAGKVATFSSATLSRATPLSALGLVDGEAPAGTVIHTTPTGTELIAAGPITVCGLALLPVPTLGQPAVTFSPFEPPAHVAVSGALVGRDVDVGGGLRMTGGIGLRYTPKSCKRQSIEGTLSQAAVHRGLAFAPNTAFGLFDDAKSTDQFVRGTLAKPAVVDGLTLTGTIMVSATKADVLHLVDGKLAKASPFEAWQLPIGTQVQRSGTGWSFTTPPKQSASARAAHRGERVDDVIEARSDDSSTDFGLRRPHTLKGTKLAMASVSIEHDTGCVLGDVATQQSFGIFTIPKDGNAALCGGTLVMAQGTYGVPSLQVGKWFATQAIAGDPKKPPAEQELLGRPTTVKSPMGYWIQINSLCQGQGGIPQPPPVQRWIWVDLKGEAKKPADRKELASLASKVGAPCPVARCCPP